MDIPTAREFIRRLYRLGATESARHVLLDEIADTALAASTAGKMMTSVNRPEGGVMWTMLMGYRPEHVMQVVDFCRARIGGTLEEALTDVAPHYDSRPNFAVRW